MHGVDYKDFFRNTRKTPLPSIPQQMDVALRLTMLDAPRFFRPSRLDFSACDAEIVNMRETLHGMVVSGVDGDTPRRLNS